MAVATDDAVAQARQRLRAWKASPPRFVRECFGATPDPWQDEVLEAFPKSPRLALKSSVGTGKSAVLSWIGWNYLATRLFPKGYATSITWPNLRDNLWAEMAKWQRSSEFLTQAFTWTQTKIFADDHPEEWWLSTRQWDRSASPEVQGQTLAGLHADYVIVIADETGAMPSAVLDQADAVLSTGLEPHVVQAGNPTHLAGPLHAACYSDRSLWTLFEITGDPDNPNRAPRVSEKWARELIEKWGREHPFVRAKVLGMFPRQATDALVSLDQLEDAYGRLKAPDGSELRRGLKTLGVDVGRFGGDESTCAQRDGDFLDEIHAWAGKDTEETSDRVAHLARELGSDEIRVDDIGVGGGVTDKLRRMHREGNLAARVHGVNVGEKATRRGPKTPQEPEGVELYANLKAQVNLEMAERRFRPGLISIAPHLKTCGMPEEAADVRYGFGRGGKVFKVESKDDFRKRHNGRSPDRWDATVLAFAELRRGAGDADLSGWGWA